MHAAAMSQGTVLYAFDAEGPGELSVDVGQAVVVQAEVDGWYQIYRPDDGQTGLVPCSYVQA